MELNFQLTGKGPMLQHNGRLANPLDPYTREIATLTGKRKKTDEERARIAYLEARASMYETDDGYVGLPNENLWRCIYDASKAFKLGEDIKKSLTFLPVTPELLIDGDPVKCDSYLDDPAHVFYKTAKVGQSKVMRSRPIFRNWSSSHDFDLSTDVLDVDRLGPVVERAGRLVCVGDWRPLYGHFTMTVTVL